MASSSTPARGVNVSSNLGLNVSWVVIGWLVSGQRWEWGRSAGVGERERRAQCEWYLDLTCTAGIVPLSSV